MQVKCRVWVDTVAHSDIALAAERFPCVPPLASTVVEWRK